VKRVIVIPIIHSAADLGSLAESVRAYYVRRFGPAVWDQRQGAVRNLWHAIRQAIDALQLDYRRVRIYQDGLPVCGKEEPILQELADAGSLNHQLVRELMGQGAVLQGTEDPQLLIREYQLQRRRLGADDGKETPSSLHGQDARATSERGQDARAGCDEAAEILAARDRFMAERIAATLQDGETGLLFLGAAHRLDAFRAAGLEVATLDGIRS
jgi:hypothetical protein